MTRIRSLVPISLAIAAIAALAVSGCGNNSSSGTASASTPKTASGSAATVGIASTDLGKVLVDSQGRTLYLFAKDKGTMSTCSGTCATDWPPLRASGKPLAGRGVKSSLLGTTTRTDGKPQVTYNGHPLYRYVGDQSAGDTNGQGVVAFGAGWYALTAAGSQVTGTGSGGSSGY